MPASSFFIACLLSLFICSPLFFLPFTSVSFLLLLLPGFAVWMGGGYTWRCSIRDRRVEEMAETSPRQVERAAIGAGKRGSPRATARLSVLTIGTASRLPHPAPPMALLRSSAHLSPPLGPHSPCSWSPRDAMSLLPPLSSWLPGKDLLTTALDP